MKNLFIAVLAVLGIMWKVDLGARVYVDWAVMAMFGAFMFAMGARVDDLLMRWELQPHWRREKQAKATTLRLG